MSQLALDLFGGIEQQEPVTPDRSPTWDDVQKGRAHVVYRFEPCDKCETEAVSFWNGEKCTHVKGNYAYPKKQPDGTCRKAYHAWGYSAFATAELPYHEETPVYTCKCHNIPRLWVAGTIANPRDWQVRCECGRKTKKHVTAEEAIEEWNERRLNEV